MLLLLLLTDAENDVLADAATQSAAQPASSTSDAVAMATSSQHPHPQQQFDDRPAGETIHHCLMTDH